MEVHMSHEVNNQEEDSLPPLIDDVVSEEEREYIRQVVIDFQLMQSVSEM